MPELVRVRDALTGHHITVTKALAESDAKRFSALKSKATDKHGRSAAPKFKVAGRTQAVEADAIPSAAAASVAVEATEATTTEATKEAQK